MYKSLCIGIEEIEVTIGNDAMRNARELVSLEPNKYDDRKRVKGFDAIKIILPANIIIDRRFFLVRYLPINEKIQVYQIKNSLRLEIQMYIALMHSAPLLLRVFQDVHILYHKQA